MKKVVLFDLGGTLARYYEMRDFPKILRQAIHEVENLLIQRGLLDRPMENVWEMVERENYESKNHRVRPLEKRLINIFQLPKQVCSEDLIIDICRNFMKPIFSLGYCYGDSIPTLRMLREKRFRTAVISNTTWGSPAYLWREEMKRLGIDRYLDAVFFCRDVGWRKPAKPIFEYALKKLGVDPSLCIFIGDDPRWDLKGPRSMGMEAILINRRGLKLDIEGKMIRGLNELFELL